MTHFLTSLTALVALPVMWYLYRRDRRNGAVETTALRGTVPWWAFLVTILLGIVSNQMITGVMNYFRVTQQFSNEVQEGLLRGRYLGAGSWTWNFGTCDGRDFVSGADLQPFEKNMFLFGQQFWGAVIFALYHGNMVQFLFALPMGLLIILLYERWHSLSIPIVFHIAANLSTVLLNCLVLK